MTEIQNNITLPQQQMMPMSKEALRYQVEMDRAARAPRTVQDEFVRQHKRNGLVERLYNGIKNLTGLGIGSKKVKAELAKVESGEITGEQARETVDKYRKSQVNSQQAFGDLMSIGASGLTFFGIRNWLKQKGAEALLNEKYFNQQDDLININKKIHKKWLGYGKSNAKVIATTAFAATLAGGFAKWGSLLINRIGSKGVDKKEFNGAKTPYDKAAYKLEKEIEKKEHGRNFLSGMINGVMMPLTLLGGGIAGIPAYFVGNSLNRYFVANKTEKDKSFNGYLENLKSDGITQAVVTTATAIPMLKKVHYTNVFDTNLKKVTDKLLNATLKDSGLQNRNTYLELESMLCYSDPIHKITESSMSVEEQAKAMIKENLFAVKMKQIANDGSALSSMLKENCPPSRETLAEAQEAISAVYGNKYEVKQLLGVGTVAETYLAKDSSGKEVCIKLLKKGITKEKVLNDKEKFIDVVKNSGKPQKEIDNLIRNIDDMSDGLIKELDLAHEKEAAEKLAEFTKICNVVKPIEIKEGVYVMEKAKGISLGSLVELNSAYFMKEACEKFGEMPKPKKGTKLYDKLKGVRNKEQSLTILNDYIKQIEARTPEFGDIKLSKEDFKALMEEYQTVFVEQFNKVDKKGKTLHADIHPGNIFIDVNALRNRKKGIINEAQGYLGRSNSNKIFTLIDTGNTITMDSEQAMRAINLTSYLKRGNVQDIAEYMMYGVEGNALGGHTKEEAIKLLKDDLSKYFFDTETRLSTLTNESLVELASNIMRKHGIVPADTQLSLNKAKQSANNSLKELYHSIEYFYEKEILDKGGSIKDMLYVVGKAAKDIGLLETKYVRRKKVQETMNLRNLTLEQVRKHKNNPNMLKTNDENYLTYQLKQKMKFHDRKRLLDVLGD